MSIQAYSFCDVELRSKTGRSSDQQSYERCSVELHHNDYDGYSLRAVRRWDKKVILILSRRDASLVPTKICFQEIFYLPLNNVSSYIMGGSPQIPDQFLGDDGTYLLLLTGEGSKTYREALNACLTDLLLTKNTPVASDTEQSSGKTLVVQKDKTTVECFRQCLSRWLTGFLGILASIQNLTEAINQGRTDAATRAAESLISKNIQLKATLNQSYRGEQLFK